MREVPDAHAGRSAEARAEEVVERMGRTLSQFASLAALRMLQAAARVREEAEDMWAEAQSIRRGERW